jgi:hypothetical protein
MAMPMCENLPCASLSCEEGQLETVLASASQATANPKPTDDMATAFQATTNPKLTDDVSDAWTNQFDTCDTLPRFVADRDAGEQSEADSESTMEEIESCDGSVSTEAPRHTHDWDDLDEWEAFAMQRFLDRDRDVLAPNVFTEMEICPAIPAQALPSELRNRSGFRTARYFRNEVGGRRNFASTSREEDYEALYEEIDWLSMENSPENLREGFRTPELPRGRGSSAVRFIKLAMRRPREAVSEDQDIF